MNNVVCAKSCVLVFLFACKSVHCTYAPLSEARKGHQVSREEELVTGCCEQPDVDAGPNPRSSARAAGTLNPRPSL